MPKGFSFVQNASQDIEDRKNSGGGGGKLFFKVDPGASIIVRFLEQGEDVACAWVHELPTPGKKVPDVEVCLAYNDEGIFTGEPCPGCERGWKRKFQGWINVIWRDAPLFQKDEAGKLVKENGANVVIGKQDQVALWSSGITVFDALSESDSTYKGLSSRDFKVSRKGSEFSTRYTISPADPDGGPQPLSEADKALAAEKYDLNFYTAHPAYEKWGVRTSGASKQQGSVAPSDTSPFMRRS